MRIKRYDDPPPLSNEQMRSMVDSMRIQETVRFALRAAPETSAVHPDKPPGSREPPHCSTCSCGMTESCRYPACMSEEPGCVIGCPRRKGLAESESEVRK